MFPRYKVFKRAANVFQAVYLSFPILLTCSGRSGVVVPIILRKGAVLYLPERLSALRGGGARATQPGAGHPAFPWVATTDPTLCATATTVRDRCDRGGSPARGPLPHAASAHAGRITPGSPQVARGAERGGAAFYTFKPPAGLGAAGSVLQAEPGSGSQVLPGAWARPRRGSQVRRAGREG